MRKNLTTITRGCCELYWTSPGGNTLQNSRCTATTKTIKVWRTRHARHWWRSKDEFISDILLSTPSHGRAKVGWPARTYLQQLCADTGCSLEDRAGAMDDRDGWGEKVREIRASSVIGWWWIYIHTHTRVPVHTHTHNNNDDNNNNNKLIYIRIIYLIP